MHERVKQIYAAMLGKHLIPSPQAGKMFLRWLENEQREERNYLRKLRLKQEDRQLDVLLRHFQER